MPLVSMKTEGENYPEAYKENPYGYGLCINLNDDQCEALGITSPPKAGTVLTITARAFVTESTSSVEADGDDKGPDVRMRLQITDLELSPARSSGKKLYEGSSNG